KVCFLASAWLKYLPDLMLLSVCCAQSFASVFRENVAVCLGYPLTLTRAAYLVSPSLVFRSNIHAMDNSCFLVDENTST
ncbi:MAG: hypothetical protein MK438_09020, partial [SAR324 cluster bacterium]|nr:hypothetical protein [SAR324 cluster bacterium]